MLIADKWSPTEYELIDSSDGERLEKFGKYVLVRPDPQVIWNGVKISPQWKTPDARYKRSSSGGGSWNRLPGGGEGWNIHYGKLCFGLKAMSFKHTGIFPEQAVNWDYLDSVIRGAGRPVSVLNLFAYTGGATVACAAAGAKVCHVDAAKNMVTQAKENAHLSGFSDAPVRYIVDDCRKFVEREIRRGSRYDIVILDPPSYGRGPTGELWKLEDNIHEFISITLGVLSEKPLLVLYNSYTTGLSAGAVAYMMTTAARSKGLRGFSVQADEIGLPVTSTGLVLPCGSTVRMKFE